MFQVNDDEKSELESEYEQQRLYSTSFGVSANDTSKRRCYDDEFFSAAQDDVARASTSAADEPGRVDWSAARLLVEQTMDGVASSSRVDLDIYSERRVTSDDGQLTPLKHKRVLQTAEPVDDSAFEPELAAATTELLEGQSGKTAVSLLGEYTARLQVAAPDYNITDSPLGFGYQVTAVVDSNGQKQTFDLGVGRNKRIAKERAARYALDFLVTSGNYQKSLFRQFILPTNEVTCKLPRLYAAGGQYHNFYQQLADEFNKFIIQQNTFDAKILANAKVTAGLLVWDAATEKGAVVAFGTGTRFVGGESLNDEGRVVNDSHAEILARRGFVRYLYHRLFDYMGGEHTIFSPQCSAKNRLQLRDGISLHLYISSAPCGDGRLFVLSELDVPGAKQKARYDEQHHPIMSDPKKHALLRVKLEKGAGAIPVFECETEKQTLDGITGGERLRTMSCSDKLLKWNVLGLQGTLLSRFVEPIYLSSIIIGSLFHHGHLARAVCCRLHGIEQRLPANTAHRLNHPVLAFPGIEDNTTRDTSRTALHSTNYNLSDDTVEFLDAGVGKPIDMGRSDGASRVCKRSLFELYKQLCARLQQPAADPDCSDFCYLDCKQSTFVAEYRETLAVFKRMIREKNYGWWLAKPREEKLFR